MSLPFWSAEKFELYDGLALVCNGFNISYSELNLKVHNYTKFLSDYNLENQLAFLPMQSDVDSVVRYLACLRESIIPLLLSPELEKGLLKNLRNIYEPALVFGPDGIHDVTIYDYPVSQSLLPKNLALLLSTSGSTGSSKLVKLSHQNLQANAKSISEYLYIQPDEKAFCSLPLSYSYGISVLNSHLNSGACVHLSSLNPLSEGYYDKLMAESITSISGVPFFYQMLFRTGFFKKDIPSLKVMTQAGGKLSDKLTVKFNEYALQHQINFYVMYGQTEATARISYVPPEALSQKIGSVGIAIPDGNLSLSGNGELIYSGPNVMLGYAQDRVELQSPDRNLGRLYTGDIGKQDEDGYFYITGRVKRFIKIAGARLGLDEIESALEDAFNLGFLVAGEDEKLLIFIEDAQLDILDVTNFLQSKYSINRTFVKVKIVKEILRKSNGKKDYSLYRDKSE